MDQTPQPVGEKNETEKKKKKKILFFLFIFFIVLALASAAALIFHLLPPKTPVPAETAEPAEPAPPTQTQTETVEEVPRVDNPIDFPALKEQNPDIAGWIRIPDSVVDYPVMRSSNGVPEDFYLNHDFQKNYLFAGCIYMQGYNSADFSDPNTILYGHNMANGSMFNSIRKFSKKDHFDKNRVIYIYTPGHIYTYQIYSAFTYDDRHLLFAFDFKTEEGYRNFLNLTLNPPSMTRQVLEGAEVTTADRILTLSTCTSVKNQRFLLVGVLIHDDLTN